MPYKFVRYPESVVSFTFFQLDLPPIVSPISLNELFSPLLFMTRSMQISYPPLELPPSRHAACSTFLPRPKIFLFFPSSPPFFKQVAAGSFRLHTLSLGYPFFSHCSPGQNLHSVTSFPCTRFLWSAIFFCCDSSSSHAETSPPLPPIVIPLPF